MQDIRRQDRRLFLQEAFRFRRLTVLVLVYALLGFIGFLSHAGLEYILPAVIGPLIGLALIAYSVSIDKRFQNKRFETLWSGCRDRLERFETVLQKMRKEQVADLHEMPRTVRRIADSLYVALRRADLISHEVHKTEHGIYMQPPAWTSPAEDPQARELYRIADKNIAEYRQQFAGVMAGVHRAEAQSAVFMTTLDTLRMKMLGYRLVGKNPELSTHDFLEALGEAKIQLQAIDQALDELDFTQMPQTITIMPPPIPEDVNLQQGNGPA